MLVDKSDKYSSSIIRSQIKEGYMEDVTESLGRPWHMLEQ